ncbi:NYN domain-containing protein [Szabonella alba]|uniref:RNase NYN domain-containing protein n=1 Tax=Szabonella alba TaxID=2804194 RepID=A0A8K0V9I5_9RHOB|nr:hypothetical protein [Szabonella alba]MBL4917606.1 hypothetical protein [Szabonella alba]
MSTPLSLTVTCLAGLFATMILPGLQDYALIAASALSAALWLLVTDFRRRPARNRREHRTRPPVVVDGSNVLHWRDGTPQLDSLKTVLRELELSGYQPGVVFDANAGYQIAGRYLHDGALGRKLGLPKDRVMVVDKGMPADPVILRAARDMNAIIVTNDRYRDWAADWPEVRQPERFIRGRFSEDGKALHLHLPEQRPNQMQGQPQLAG